MRSVAPGSANAADAALPAVVADSGGAAPSRSPSSASPTSAMRAALEQRRHPAVLADDVVDQGADVPVRARCRRRPGAVGHLVDRGQEGVDRTGVEADDVGLSRHVVLPARAPVLLDRAPGALARPALRKFNACGAAAITSATCVCR